MNISKYIITLFCASLLFGCHKDSEEELTRGSSTTQTTVINYKTVTGMVSGLVYDEEKHPITNALINIDGQMTESDEIGFFTFENIDLDPLGTYVTAEKDGFILGSDFFYPGPGINRSYIQMMALSQNKTFKAAAGGVLQVDGGGTVTFDQNAIATENGDTYSGLVMLTAKRLATDDPNIYDLMPGGLVGIDEENQSVVLGSYGMMAVELRGENGQELNLASGHTATVTFPIASDQLAYAPETIPLWHFDEINGVWKEEGFAIRRGDYYEGNVSHFSFWNCDAPFPVVHFCATILNADGTPSLDTKVSICADNLGVSHGYTCNGEVSGKVPKDRVLTIKVYGSASCADEIIYEAEIGPFSEDVKLDPITLASSGEMTLIMGNVYCEGAPLSNSLVIISGDNFQDIIQTNDNGSFEYYTCYDGEINIFGKNLETNEASTTAVFDIDSGTSNLSVNLETCSDCSFDANIEIDGTIPCDNLFDLEVIHNGTGTYTYLWSNGGTSKVLKNMEIGIYNVTISETGTDCTIALNVIVEEEENYLDIETIVEPAACDGSTESSISIIVSNGVAPYTYQWAGPGGFTSTQSNAMNIESGAYDVTVTDANGCSKYIRTQMPTPGIVLPDIDTFFELNCYQTEVLIDLFKDYEEYNYEWIDGSGTVIGNDNTISINRGGQYIVHIIDPNTGCQTIYEIVVLENVEIPELSVYSSCSDYTITYNVDILIFVPSILLEVYSDDGTLLNQGADDLLMTNIDIFDLESSSNLTFVMTDINSGCQSYQTIEAPNTTPTSFEISAVEPPSCNTCMDGKISTQITNQACTDCTIVIYQKLNEEYINVTQANEAGELGQGEYFVSLVSEDCVQEYENINL